MRLIVVLFLSLAILAVLSDPVKSNDKDKARAYAVKKAKLEKEQEEEVKTESFDELQQDAGISDDDLEGDDEDEKPAPKRKNDSKSSNKKKDSSKAKKGKKNGKEITEEVKEEEPLDADTENVYEACNYDTSGDNELCHCDMEEINCSSILMESDDPMLHTMDIDIMKKDFKPVIANFSSNAITRLQKNKVLPRFEKYVSVLDISHNQLRFADSDVFKPFTALTKLNLAHNNFQAIKKPIFDAVKDTLHRLDLGYNRIKSLPDGVFEGLSKLKVLSLDGNPIKHWNKEIFKGLVSLETLSLDGCSIEDLPADIFEYLPKLVGVSLRGNPIEEIPAVVAHTKSLKTVDMSETNLTEIRDHAFAGDSDLTEIILEKMSFLSVVRDCAFCGLPKLEILLLNDNKKLLEIHPNAFGFIKSEPGHKAASIKELSIHNSNLTTISEHMLNYDNLNIFKVGGNPWNCDCSTMFLMEEKFSFKQDSIAPKCSTPENLKDKHLATVRVTDACEDVRFLGRSGRFSSVLGLGLLTIFLALGAFYLYSSGRLEKLVRQVRKEPEVIYTNLQSVEEVALETDFQPRPAEV